MDEIDQLRMMRDEITRGHSASEAVDIVRRYATEDRPRAELLDRFLEASMRLDPAKLREVLMSAESMGVEETMRDVALPAMREMGSRWKAGVCDTAHEHLATEAVRAWLVRQSVMAPFRRSRSCSRAVQDLHTIGLEAFGVVLARRGWSIRTLGPPQVSSLVAAVRAAEARGVDEPAQRHPPAGGRGDRGGRRPGRRARVYAGAAFGPAAARKDVPGTYLGEDIIEAAEILEVLADAA